MVETITDQNFAEKVENSELPVLVDFYADWCGPCRMMAPAVEKMAEVFDGQIVVGKLNVDDNMDTAERYGVRSIPYIAVLKKGKVAGSQLGATGEEALEAMIRKAIAE